MHALVLERVDDDAVLDVRVRADEERRALVGAHRRVGGDVDVIAEDDAPDDRRRGMHVGARGDERLLADLAEPLAVLGRQVLEVRGTPCLGLVAQQHRADVLVARRRREQVRTRRRLEEATEDDVDHERRQDAGEEVRRGHHDRRVDHQRDVEAAGMLDDLAISSFFTMFVATHSRMPAMQAIGTSSRCEAR